MKLSKEMQKLLVDELIYIVENMRTSKNSAQKLYFFSAAFGIAHRIINIEYDGELNFVHSVLNASYAAINQRLAAISTGAEMGAGIPENTFSRLEEELEEIIKSIQAGKETYPALQKISNIGYAATGNGYYLYLKGLLKL